MRIITQQRWNNYKKSHHLVKICLDLACQMNQISLEVKKPFLRWDSERKDAGTNTGDRQSKGNNASHLLLSLSLSWGLSWLLLFVWTSPRRQVRPPSMQGKLKATCMHHLNSQDWMTQITKTRESDWAWKIYKCDLGEVWCLQRTLSLVDWGVEIIGASTSELISRTVASRSLANRHFQWNSYIFFQTI